LLSRRRSRQRQRPISYSGVRSTFRPVLSPDRRKKNPVEQLIMYSPVFSIVQSFTELGASNKDLTSRFLIVDRRLGGKPFCIMDASRVRLEDQRNRFWKLLSNVPGGRRFIYSYRSCRLKHRSTNGRLWARNTYCTSTRRYIQGIGQITTQAKSCIVDVEVHK
jgi:hypothetical protein